MLSRLVYAAGLLAAASAASVSNPARAAIALTPVYAYQGAGTLDFFNVTTAGDYRFTVAGAAGGALLGGSGALLTVDYTLAANTTLGVFIGTAGSGRLAGSGGGGTFVTLGYSASPQLLVAAGGGGGGGSSSSAGDAADGQTGTSGSSGLAIDPRGTQSGVGGRSGAGGSFAVQGNNGGGGGNGGGGYQGEGEGRPYLGPNNTTAFEPGGGASYREVYASAFANQNTGVGVTTLTTGAAARGGSGGGGGGYSGGGGGAYRAGSLGAGGGGGGGGGSFYASGGTLVAAGTASKLANNGAGYFLLQQITDIVPGAPAPNPPSGGPISDVPEPATWVLMLLGFGGVGLGLRMAGRSSASAVSI